MKIIRSLGFGELRMHLQHSLAAGTTQGALLVRVNGHIDMDQVKACVDQIRSQHEILNLSIVKQDKDYFFAQNPESNPNHFIHRKTLHSENEWLINLHAEIETIIDSSVQLWKLITYSYSEPDVTDFVLVMHHAVMDAVGSEYFFDTLFSLLTSSNKILKNNAVLPTPIAMEADSLSACDWTEFTQSQQKAQELLIQVNLQPHLNFCPIELRKTKILSGKLHALHVEALEEFSAENEFSLNSLFSVLFTRAVYEETLNREKFALFSAVSLRPLCPNAPKKEFGCYLSVMPTLHEFNDSWNLIDEAKKHKRNQHQAFMDIARWVPHTCDSAAIEKTTQDAVDGNIFKNDLGFTYAETGLKPSYGALKISHQYVGARRSLGNVALILHGLKCADCIYFTLSYVDPLQDGDYANRVLQRFFKLTQAVSTHNNLAIEAI